MRLSIAAASLALLTTTSLAQTAAPAPVQPVQQLKPGMPAPPLTIETWVKGEPVTAFEPGKIYVIEFWATWCGPCVASMPHLSLLQREFADKGLTIIGVTCADSRGNTLDNVKMMVAARGDGMGYTVAWDKERTTSEAFLRAAGKSGIPCSFVVDKQGRVAYIGHPMFLDEPLAEIIAGTWDIERDSAELEAASQGFFAMFGEARTDPKGTLTKLAEFESKHPHLVALTDPLRFHLLLGAGEFEQASTVGTRVVQRAASVRDVAQLADVARTIIDPDTQLAQRDLELALGAAQEAVKATGEKDAGALELLARVQAARNEHPQAVATLTQALQVANERQKANLMRLIEEYRAKPASGG